MKTRPIIFSTPMVRALLDGRKTQTRRLITSPLAKADPGDLLYVREAWRPVNSGDPSKGARYRFDAGTDQTVWRPSIHMPRWASRLTLKVTDRRVQLLHWISEEDAIAEGCTHNVATARSEFVALWSQLHGTESWLRNPEVVALTFEVHKVNVDRFLEACAA